MGTNEENGMKIFVEIPREKLSYGDRYISGAVPFVLGVALGTAAFALILSQKDTCWAVCTFVGAAGFILLLYAVYCWFIRNVLFEDRKRAKDREDFISGKVNALKDIILSQQKQQSQRNPQVRTVTVYHVILTEKDNVTGGK